jgi:hypothetical protein
VASILVTPQTRGDARWRYVKLLLEILHFSKSNNSSSSSTAKLKEALSQYRVIRNTAYFLMPKIFIFQPNVSEAAGCVPKINITERVEVISEKVAGVSASGFAADFGVMVRPWGAGAARNPWFRRSSLGAAVRNLGQGLKFDSETAALPTEYVLGLGYSQPFSGDLLTTGVDLHQVTGEKTSVSFGAEYWLKGLLALRVGYRSTDNTGAGLRAGAGFRLGKVTLDYAWSGLGENLGAAHRLTLGFRFGEPTPAPGLSADVYGDFVERGKRHMDLKLYDRAILDFNEALKINPASAEVQQWLLECGRLMEGGDPR